MLSETLNQFPITSHLDEICQALKNSPSHSLILTAQTAAGKSTILPLGLLQAFEGKILMTEPRRLAVLGVANRVSDLCNEKCGETVGYKIHLENKIGSKTRLEVVTEAILVRQLQSDSILENYKVVVLDEFHERSINLDLALAFLKEAMELRDDLYVIVMSATIDTKKLEAYLGASVLSIPGRQFAVETEYAPDCSVEQAVKRALKDKVYKGNILAFLPGISEIRKCESNLIEMLDEEEAEICVLHSSVSLEQQKYVLKENTEKRRVILSSAIAETSLTVPGITTVIDCGLARLNRMELSVGMEKLCTEVESEFSAEQRKGRAGRIQKGKCIRLWSELNPRKKEQAPEILRTDLTSLVLDCAERGIYSPDKIDWLDKPLDSAWKVSAELLYELGMTGADGRITQKGKNALTLGMHPRLAGIALAGFDGKQLLNEAKKLLIKYGSYSKSAPAVQQQFMSDLERRLGKSVVSGTSFAAPGEKNLILAGYPDRLAKRTSAAGESQAEYQFPSGRKAVLNGAGGAIPDWIIAPEVLAGDVKGRIFEYETISQTALEEFLAVHQHKETVCEFLEGKLLKSEKLCFGKIELSSKKMPVSPEDYALAWVNEVQKKGIESLPLDEKTKRFLLRTEFYYQQNKLSGLYEKITENAQDWLVPFMAGLTGGKNLNGQTVYEGLYWYLEGSKIDSEVPEQIVLANGRKCKVKYEKQAEIQPVIEIIIQRIFGCFETPEICGKKVLLKLLSPASRPLQVTQDLEHFWSGAWIEICKEMKGRYPKHNWDYRIVEKE